MIDAREDPDEIDIWRAYGAQITLESYGSDSLDAVPDSHWHFLTQTCCDFYETDTHIFVHGHLYPDQPVKQQPISKLHWLGIDDAEAHHSGKTVICGHRPQDNGMPLDRGFAIGLDTTGWLTCIDVTTSDCWQVADEDHATRQFKLRP